MVYVDTSVIVAYYCPEPLSERAESEITAHVQPAISDLTELEFFSAISRKVREGSLERSHRDRILAQFLAHVEGFFYTCLRVERHHFLLARDWIGRFSTSLKALDALHLAIASLEGLTLITADEALAKAAQVFAVNAVLLTVP